MSEVIEPKTQEAPGNTLDISATTGSGIAVAAPSSRLSKLTSGKSWVSPFRGGTKGDNNLVKKYKQTNSIDGVKVPKKFAAHPTLDAEERRLKAEANIAAAEDKAAKAAVEPTETTEEVNEPTETTETTEDATEGTVEEATEEASEEATEATEATEVEEATETPETIEAPETIEEPTEKVEEALKEPIEEPIEVKEASKEVEPPTTVAGIPEKKYEPIKLPSDGVVDKLKDKPVLLNRYNDLNAQAIGSINKSIDDPHEIIDLGSGLKMSRQELLAIAALRVAPVLSSINTEVNKTRNEDEIKRQQDISSKVKSHEKTLQGDYDKYLKKIDKQKEKFTKEQDLKESDLAKLVAAATASADAFEKNTHTEIETANTEFAEREAKAVEKHATDKETLEKNHVELVATKEQELEDTKAKEETTTQEIEEFEEKKSGLNNSNTEFSTKIEELTAQLEEQTSILDGLKSQHAEKKDLIAKNVSTKEELDTTIATNKKSLAEKQTKHDGLAAEVGVLAAVLASYTAKLDLLKSDKESRLQRLDEAKTEYKTWESDKTRIAKETALEGERKRLLAVEEYETKKKEEELERQKAKEEKERIAEEEAEEKARLAEIEAEEKARLAETEAAEKAKLAEEAAAEKERLAEEAAAEEERLANEKARLAKERELLAENAAIESEKLALVAAAEKKRVANEAAEKEASEKTAREKYLEAEELRLANNVDSRKAARLAKIEAEERQLAEERADNELSYSQRKELGVAETNQLQDEIENLRLEKEKKLEIERAEAEKLAQIKLEEIEKLKEEHKLRVQLFQEKVAFEEIKKQRILEEVDNLKLIRDLREEKVRLAQEVQSDSELKSIQRLIEARELEASTLTRQLELDDRDLTKLLGTDKSFLGDSDEVTSKVDHGAHPVSKALVEEHKSREVAPIVAPVRVPSAVTETTPTEKESKVSTTGAVVGSLAAAVGVGAVASSSSKRAPKSEEGLTSKLKSLGRRLSKSESTAPNAEKKPAETKSVEKVKPAEKKTENVKPTEKEKPAEKEKSSLFSKFSRRDSKSAEKIAKAPVATTAAGTIAAASTDPFADPVIVKEGEQSDHEIFSKYEEVSDSEFQTHADDPNYIEVSIEEYNALIARSKINN